MTDASRQSEPVAVARMRKRPQFLACAQGAAFARGAVVVQARDRADGAAVIHAGFTATKRVGGSVVRNRAKRRLREAARLMLPDLARPGYDYVFIARGGAPNRPWPRLLDDVKTALLRLAPESDRRPPATAPSPQV